jgi:DMSO/TMAO reductase YedYZ heme-binding membrane subunit
MDRRLDTLSLAAAAFVAANLLHTLDHLRQGTGDLATEVLAGGTVLSALAILTLVLAVRRHPRAALWAAVVGTWSALGVIASHVAPHWSAFSDSYFEIDADALSWAVMLAEVLTAAYLGLVGFRELRRQATGRPAAAST